MALKGIRPISAPKETLWSPHIQYNFTDVSGFEALRIGLLNWSFASGSHFSTDLPNSFKKLAAMREEHSQPWDVTLTAISGKELAMFKLRTR